MKLISHDVKDQEPMDPSLAFGRLADDQPMALSDNRSPHLKWSDFPDETQSFVLLCMDPDVPSVGDDVNQAGKTLPVDLPRVDFCHWVMIDIPNTITELATGACSEGVVIGGKATPAGPPGTRQGLNDYTSFMAGNPDMAGEYRGYDGPCPPWNDERLHHYQFTVYALSVRHLMVSNNFDGHEVKEAITPYILDQATLTGTYSLFSK